jgi:hypothetical protein
VRRKRGGKSCTRGMDGGMSERIGERMEERSKEA